ncbi:MAG: elongation factor P hydroxylase [Pseudomonadota bacterium]
MNASDLASERECDQFNADDLILLFNALFAVSQKTILVSGGEEPLYLPAAQDNELARVIFTADYFASALHEVAHWCLAGKKRRALVDYGYWYVSNRNVDQQREFERAEVKPQALEQLFAEACGYPFKPSFDNLRVPEYSSEWFDRSRAAQVQHFLEQGLPVRARQFYAALKAHYSPFLCRVVFSG